jgi:hypothetical protein
MIGPIKSHHCWICDQRHFLGEPCDPFARRVATVARDLAAALEIEAMVEARRNAPRLPYRPMSYGEEIAWNDPWWVE